jgi:hypothetical protein
MRHRPAVAAFVALGVVAGSARVATASAPANPQPACAPCTYHVTPNGAGSQSLAYVLQNLVQAHDTVVLADGVYRVANLQVSAPDVTIVAQHVPPAGAQPTAWLDGSVPYRWWNHPSPRLWSHSYNKDFCNTTTAGLPCAQVPPAYHSDQVFQHGDGVVQVPNSAYLAGPYPAFYADRVHNQLLLNFDPGGDTEVTDLETALVFTRTAVQSTLEGIGVRRYAGNDHNGSDLAAHQNAAVFVMDATGVSFIHDYFSFNGVRGLKTQGDVPPAQTPVAGADILIDGSTFDHNGEMGLNSVDSDGITVERSVFYRNNTKNYPGYGEASGAKLLCTYGARILGNLFRANSGMGLWFDRSSYNAFVASNIFQENTWDGFKYEVSAHATVTGNFSVSNDRSGLLVYESSQVSLSHNYLRGNLIGIEVHEERRTVQNTPSARDSDHDRIMPPDITFDVKAIDIHANGFYYARPQPTYARCNPSSTVQFTLDGCEYGIAVEDDLAQRDASVLDITTSHDNFHLDNWPTSPLAAAVPVFIAMWQAQPAHVSGGGCVFGAANTRQLRWTTLPDFQCTGQEYGAARPY